MWIIDNAVYGSLMAQLLCGLMADGNNCGSVFHCPSLCHCQSCVIVRDRNYVSSYKHSFYQEDHEISYKLKGSKTVWVYQGGSAILTHHVFASNCVDACAQVPLIICSMYCK